MLPASEIERFKISLAGWMRCTALPGGHVHGRIDKQRGVMLKERELRGQKNASQSKIETPPQGWRRAGDAIAGGDEFNKIVLAGCDVKFYLEACKGRPPCSA